MAQRIITIASNKGGVGKTTVAVHVAAYFQSQEIPAALIDGDMNRSALSWASGDRLTFPVYDENILTTDIHKLTDRKILVIDTPARPQLSDLKSLANSDLVIVPILPGALELRPTLEFVSQLRELKAHYRILIVGIPPYPSRSGAEMQETLRELKLPVFSNMIPRSSCMQDAAFQGVSINIWKSKRVLPIWKRWLSVGAEIQKEIKGNKKNAQTL